MVAVTIRAACTTLIVIACSPAGIAIVDASHAAFDSCVAVKSNETSTGRSFIQRSAQMQPLPSLALQNNSTEAQESVLSKLPRIDVAERYLKLVEMAVTGSLIDEAGSCVPTSESCRETKPFDAKARESGADWPPYGHTMVGHKRLQNIRMAIEETIANKIPGDFAELGVWRGGTCIYAKALYDVYDQQSRHVHVFDAFGEVPAFLKRNPAYEHNANYLAVSQESVKHNFRKYGVLDDSVKFYKGLFKDTLPTFAHTNALRHIAVLRIDGNFYDSYQDSLYYLYPMVPVGGIIIFDDVMVDKVAMAAWVDFKADNGLTEELTQIDFASAWFRKTVDIKIDLVRRPYKDCNIEEKKKKV